MVPVKTIGLVNGTSFEGADTALLETDGVTLSRTGPSIHRPYSTPERILLRQTLADRRARARGSLAKPNSWSPRRTRRPSNACSRRSASIAPKSRSLGSLVRPCCIGPLRGLTVQIGDGPGLARRLGIPGGVRFPGCRRGCRRAGRHWCHYTITRLPRHPIAPVAVLNIGRVANVTYVDQNVAVDTGPATPPWTISCTRVQASRLSRIGPCACCRECPSPFREQPVRHRRRLASVVARP